MKKILSVTSIALVLVFCFTSFSACATVVYADEISKDYTRNTSEQGVVDQQFITAMTEFSANLFGAIVNENKRNLAFSPLSAIYCLAMIANGTANDTLAELESLFGIDGESLNKSLHALMQSLYSGSNCKFDLANSLWIKKAGEETQINVKPAFLQTNANWLNAQVFYAPFDNTTLNDINKWCSKNTDGLIKKVLDSISQDAVMYLVNALLFDAKWQKRYENDDIVSNYDFNNRDGSTSKVEMMCSQESKYVNGDDFSGFAKDYYGGKYSFWGILPNEGIDIFDFATNLNGQNLRDMAQVVTTTVKVRLPEFTCESEFLLNDVLKQAGVNKMFSTVADFSRLTDDEVLCNFIKQKTFIDVSRNGTKAAAITIGGLDTASAPLPQNFQVYLDRPFVYAIVDNASGLPLFLGIVESL